MEWVLDAPPVLSAQEFIEFPRRLVLGELLAPLGEELFVGRDAGIGTPKSDQGVAAVAGGTAKAELDAGLP
jgi:hypothetical protein